MLDVGKIRKDFPVLKRKVNGKPLVYLDNAATSQKPIQVIKAISNYYKRHNANVHRGIHTLSDESNNLYSEARRVVAKFVGAKDPLELVFVRNTTEAINLVAFSWGRENVKKGDVILLTEMEHHSNLLPWQRLAREVDAKLEFVKVTDEGLLDADDMEKKLELKPKLLALVQVSNFLGTINDVQKIARGCKAQNAECKVLVDGAQAVAQIPVDVSKLGVDFYAFSGHKMLGPMGSGGLWVRREILEEMSPFLMGGGMISEVYFDHATFADLPERFEGGTPDVASAIGLATAVKYLENIGREEIRRYERELAAYAIEKLKAPRQRTGRQNSNLKITIYGPRDVDKRCGLVAFSVAGVHAHDVAQVLDSEGIAVRSGHHCTMPMHERLKLSSTTRASFALYNTKEEIDRLVEGLLKVKKVFRL